MALRRQIRVGNQWLYADEAYKAQNGSYTDTAGLVAAGLLKSTPASYTINSSGVVSPITGNANGCT